MTDDPILQRIVPVLAEVPGVAAIALGGSRARGTATETSDYDIGLYYSAERPLDTNRLLQGIIGLNIPISAFAEDRRHLNEAFMDLTERGVK